MVSKLNNSMDNEEIISKEDAVAINQKWFYTGLECSKGHLDKRYVNTGICYACKRLQNKRCNKNNPETFKERCSRNYINHSDSIKARNQRWAEENRDKSSAIKRRWHEANIDSVRVRAKEYQKEQRKDPFKRISKNMSKAIWKCLKGGKGGDTWLSFVDFTIEELTIHLESKFKDGMTWENYGPYWHIDHIKPLSWFNLETEFKDAWCLANLQPLEAEINLSKNNRYEG